jgi:L-cystine transport system permease protein
MGFNSIYFYDSLRSGIQYLPNTFQLTFIPIVIALILGTVIAVIRVYRIPFLAPLLVVLITLYQGIPLVVALMIYHLLFIAEFNDFAAALHLDTSMADINLIWIGIFALSLQATCYMEESIKGAFFSVDKGQYEAGYSVGLTKLQTLRRIIIPQVIPVALPMLTNNIVGAIKGSSIVMVIGITEVLAGSVIPSSKTYAFFEGYIAAALIYWIFTILVEKIAARIEKRGDKYRRNLV